MGFIVQTVKHFEIIIIYGSSFQLIVRSVLDMFAIIKWRETPTIQESFFSPITLITSSKIYFYLCINHGQSFWSNRSVSFDVFEETD